MKKFGLIGYPLGHSFSKQYFTEKFAKEHLTDCIYELYPLADIEDVRLLFEVEKGLLGLNVTIPYKESIIRYIDHLDASAEKIGAVNCIKIDKIQKTGFNTDYQGFMDSIKPMLQKQHSKALILGTGGSSKAVMYALQMLDIETKYVSRAFKPGAYTYTDLNKGVLENYTVIINTSPLGMYPDITNCPDIPYQYLTKQHICFDLVYNPSETLFLRKAKQQGAKTKNGLQMLELQAEYAWNIWNT